jgi:hypothetical protein
MGCVGSLRAIVAVILGRLLSELCGRDQLVYGGAELGASLLVNGSLESPILGAVRLALGEQGAEDPHERARNRGNNYGYSVCHSPSALRINQGQLTGGHSTREHQVDFPRSFIF